MNYLQDFVQALNREIKVLEICVGNGWFCDIVCKYQNIAYLGIDRSPEKCRMLSEKFKSFINIKILELDITKDLNQLKPASYDLILCSRSLHFLTNIPRVLEDIRTLLVQQGRFFVLNFPIFELHVDMEYSDGELNEIFKHFYSSTFAKDLEEYWSNEVSLNFHTYCDPDRENKSYWLNSRDAISSLERTEQIVEVKEISLLDIDPLLRNSTVVEKFLEKNGEEGFTTNLLRFYSTACRHLQRSLQHLYFEDVRVMMKQSYYLEMHVKLT